MKLTGWFRMGIVLSVLWCIFIIGISINQYNNISRYGLFVSTLYDPLDIFDKISPTKIVNYGNIFLSMIIPVASGWLLVFIIVWTIKWIIRGFKSDSSQS
jgi:hypothetical protein